MLEFNYMMLSRLKSDCDYYLGNGNRSKNQLYYFDEQKHIDKMKELYNCFPDVQKPEWLTYEQILAYEKAMVKTMSENKIKIRMLKNVRPDLIFLAKPGTILRQDFEYDAITNQNGAISGLCDNGEYLGVKPGEFEFTSAPEWVLAIHNESEFDLNHSIQRGKRLAGAYAGKYIADRINRDVSKITDDDLTKCFSGCVVTPKVEWYPAIRQEIEKLIIEANGEPIGAERQ